MRFSIVFLAGTAALTSAAVVPHPPQGSSYPTIPRAAVDVLNASPVKVGINANVDVDADKGIGTDIDADIDADIDSDVDAHVDADIKGEAHLTKRRAGARLNGAAEGIGAGASIAGAMSGLLQKLFPISNWTSARETFTKATVDAMWARNPDRKRWVAAACYNMKWDVANRAGISDVASVKLSMGALNTDYDCFYIGRHNALWTRGDGGYVNLAIVSDNGFCRFDSRTSDLDCK